MKTRTQSYRSPPRELDGPARSRRSPSPVQAAPPALIIPSASGRSLASLPTDILREILQHVLAAPNGPTRPAVLQVCSLFHELGHLSLFHHVRVATVKSWEAMFGIEGYLATTDSGGKGHGHRVREVQLDRAVTERQDSDWSFPVSRSLSLPNVRTITLSHRVTETWTAHPELPLDYSDRDIPPGQYHHRHIPATLFMSIFRQLPAVDTLAYLAPKADRLRPLGGGNPPESGRAQNHARQPISTLLGLTDVCEVHENSASPVPVSPFPWPNLRAVHFVGALVLDDPREDEHFIRSTAFSFLPSTVDTLIVSFADDFAEKGEMSKWFLRAFLRGFRMEERQTRWAGVNRIEVRRLDGGARRIEERLRGAWKETCKKQKVVKSMGAWDGTWRVEDRRLADKVVFVDQNGTERRLVD